MSDTEKGKVTLRIAMDASDVQGLIDAFKAGKLAEFGVAALEFPDNPGLNAQIGDETHADRHRPTGESTPPRR
jgi:hypothetical protein